MAWLDVNVVQNYVQDVIWQPEHWDKVQWDQLWRPDAFEWLAGVTPFSQPIVPAASLVVYWITIFGLQVTLHDPS